jgi:DNA-directed RNA polymerase subunit RPC12/RpoP
MQKNVWLGVVGVIALGLAGWRFFSGDKEFKLASEFRTYGVCLVCKAENEALFHKGENEPLKCPSCGERAFYSWWYCNECHYKFVPDFLKDGTSTPKPNPFAKCAHCNCQSVAKFDPEFHTPRNSVALPKWPPK